jgi:CDP-diglyceride synthetase
MVLIIVYLVFMVIGDILAYFIGSAVDRTWPTASLPVFLGLYFLFLYVAWLLAVWITEPKKGSAAAH